MSIPLSEEQQKVVELFRERKNIFLTGPGGSGKSALIKRMYMEHTASSSGEKTMCVCAMTGCAAVLLGCGAKTVHNFSGIGIGKGTIHELVDRVFRHHKKAKRWRQTRVLIVDEVSMMSKKLLETLDAVARRVRMCDQPFGGMQVIFCGDFYQICPVGSSDDPDSTAFCFESPLWFKLFPPENHVILTKIFRQRDDVYAGILNEVRIGKISPEAARVLQQCVGRPRPTDRVPTRLFAVRHLADAVNQQELARLDSPVVSYKRKEQTEPARSGFTSSDIQSELHFLRTATLAEEVLHLKKGAHVMSIINMELPDGRCLCNGSRGVILGFVGKDNLPVVRFDNGVEKTMEYHRWESDVVPGVRAEQIPLVLAWGLTIHKSQGCSLEEAEMDLGLTVFEYGQTYVALSRVKSLEGLYLTSLHLDNIFVNPRVRNFYRALEER